MNLPRLAGALAVLLILYLVVIGSVHAGVSGTGFFINKDGYVATAQHVVRNQEKYYLVLDKKLVPATLIAEDIQHDVAILKVNYKNEDYLPLQLDFANQSPMKVYGYPAPPVYGKDLKVTTGVAWHGGIEGNTVHSNASICPGNSGGPMVGASGVIGILTTGYTANVYNDHECTTHNSGSNVSYLLQLANNNHIMTYSDSNRHTINKNIVVLIYAE